MTSGDTGIITLWNLASGRRVRDFPDTASPHSFLVIGPYGEWAARTPGTVSLWNTAEGVPRRVEVGSMDWLLFSPRRDTLSIWEWGSLSPSVYDISSEMLRTPQDPAHRKHITAEAYSLDGTTLATAGAEGAIFLWDVATLDRLFQFYGHISEVRSLAFSPNARTLASGTQDGLLKLWDLASGTELASFKGHTGPLRQVCFTDDGLTLASCADAPGGGSEVFLWRAAPRK